LWGAISGVALAWRYRKYIIRRDKFDWEEEEEEDEEGGGEGRDEGENTDSVQVEKPEEIILSQKTPSEIRRPNNVSHTGEF